MHSILESDGILSDPYEVLCCMGTLIVEGRTPKSVCDSISSGDSSETAAKTGKPYNEGPHCPNHIKLYAKDAHKCTENNMLCIRYNNLRQHLQYLHRLSPTIAIEVALGPDCLCGELRSQSTLVSTQPSKRDTILEQWTITIGSKQSHESTSQMSVLNVYQAVRSLLHFSQLTAWYMSTNGTKPANVIYRVVAPDDATYIADDDFVSHNLPLVDVNKTVSMKISLKTLPRREKIPTVFCLQHSCPSVDTSEGSRFEESSSDKNYLSPKPLHSNFSSASSKDVTLPLKFHAVRKKTNEAQERKRKKHIALYNSPAPLELEGYSEIGILDGMPVDVNKIPLQNDSEISGSKRTFPGKGINSAYLGECSKTEFKKSKPSTFSPDFSELIKQQNTYEAFDTFSCNYFEQKMVDPTLDLMLGLKGLSDSKRKSDFRTKGKSKNHSIELKAESTPEKKTVMDILDDRMQISCAISGKHHCKWECEEENDLNNAGGNAEKPKRRRSLSRVKATDDVEELKSENSDSEKILYGKYKKTDWFKSDLYSPLQESEVEEVNECEKNKFPQIANCSKIFPLECPPKSTTNLTVSNIVKECTSKPQTPKIESLSLNYSHSKESEVSDTPEVNGNDKSFVEEASGSSLTEEKKIGKGFSAIRKESFESFRKGCAVASNSCTDYVSDSEEELSDGHLESSNPFLAAILRTSRKSKASASSKTPKKCDNSVESKFLGEEEKEETSGVKKLSSEKNRTLEQNSLREEKLKDSFKSYLSLKSKVEFKAKAEECKLESNKRIGGKTVDCCGTNKSHLDLRCGRRKPSAVKGPKEIVGIDDSEKNCSGSSELLTKSLTRLKSLFDKQDLKHEERTSDGSIEESSSCNSNTKTIPVPSAHDKLKFRRSLDTAAQLVFHRCSGLPLTSSPAPVRRNNNSFSFDSSLNSVSAIKSALFEPANSLSSEDENESEGSLKSPASPGAWSAVSKQINYHSLSPLPLLGSFEESVLNGRLEPVSTVQGFTAELGASGSFCPRHLCLPVTVFFYTLGDNDKVSAPYLGHINLGKKGYNVPRSGTIQVTLFNPLRTVVKMFVVVYDLSDMPVNSHTFLRQRTLYVPTSQKESTYTDQNETFGQNDYHKYLRYLIHLRFVSGKTGRIYLHTDIRMVIFRKADEDTATALGKQINEGTYELRSHTHGPINPKFSPRK